MLHLALRTIPPVVPRVKFYFTLFFLRNRCWNFFYKIQALQKEHGTVDDILQDKNKIKNVRPSEICIMPGINDVSSQNLVLKTRNCCLFHWGFQMIFGQYKCILPEKLDASVKRHGGLSRETPWKLTACLSESAFNAA